MNSYTVRRTVSGTAKMCRGGIGGETWEEPATTAHIFKAGRYITSIRLNACWLCLPDGSVRGMDATDDQIIRAVLGDEDIFTGAPAFPGHHDAVTAP